jgi:transposase, IS5 family
VTGSLRCSGTITAVAKAAEAKLLRTGRLRADTTVVPADVAYPTDSGLLARAVRRIATTAPSGAGRRRCHPHPAARPQPRRRGAGREIGAKLRLRAAQGRDEAQATVAWVTGELAELAERVVIRGTGSPTPPMPRPIVPAVSG